MATPLLTTKLHIPPVRPELVSRPRLIERLNAALVLDPLSWGQRTQGDKYRGLHRKLTLISAPAGYGKTTLVSAWLHSADWLSTWLSLDERDNDLVRFFTYLVAALQKIDDEIGQAVQNLLEAPQLPPAESLVTALINGIAATPNPFVFVVDDYHTVAELAIHEAVGFLLERQPPQMHLVIITRQDPLLPLSRLRGRGQVTEIRQSDLRFTPEEAATFLNQSMGLNLAASDVATLEDRTEGWIAGLQLAALSMQGYDAEGAARFIDGFSGRHHFILDYLTDEVLKRQLEPVQTFLLQTSILERMCGPLCDAVLEIRDWILDIDRDTQSPISNIQSSREVLEYLEHANLFLVPLDDERKWYRYHHLFAELLRARLQETQPDQVPELHRCAAMWYEQNGLASEAVHHALATKDFTLAADVIERAILTMATWSSTDVAELLRWLKALPDDVVRTRPWLQLFTSRALYTTGQWEAAEHIQQELDRWLRDNPAAPDAERLMGLVAADRASYAAARGDVRQATEFARRAIARLPKDDAIAQIRAPAILGLACLRTGDVAEASEAFSQTVATAVAAGIGFVAAPLACNLAEVQIVQGQLRQAMRTCEKAVQLGTIDGGLHSATGFVGLVRAKILYEWNDLPAAERHVSEGLELLSRGGITATFGTGHARLAQIKQARGDSAGALAEVQRAVQIAQRSSIQRLSILASAYQARIWLAQGELDSATRWADDYRQIGETEYLREFEDLTLARVLLAQDKPTEALTLLDTLLSPAETAGRMGPVIEIQALRALALQALGDSNGALGALERALKLAEPEGYRRVFIDGGAPMTRLVHKAAQRGIAPEYTAKLLAAFELEVRDVAAPTTDRKPAIRKPSVLIEPLTDRELEVLHLLAEGLSNRKIARKLFLSPNTVRTHTYNIYGKLGVHSRMQAVARARELGLLASV